MRYANRQLKQIVRDFVSSAGLLGVAWILSPPLLVSVLGCRPKAPDLNPCTRIELRYDYGALDHFFPSTGMQGRILSEEERRHVQSYDTWTTSDQQFIKAFARDISQGVYRHKVRGYAPMDLFVQCYQGEKRVMSFSVHSRSIITGDRYEFEYPAGFLDRAEPEPPGIHPFRTRWKCAWNLRYLFSEAAERRHPRCPDPNQWCDVLVAVLRSEYRIDGDQNDRKRRTYSDGTIARLLICPSAHPPGDMNDIRSGPGGIDLSTESVRTWQSDYAQNSACTDHSAEDTVLWFETKPGWNQHGGPELFTFDNHDPKGGLVLLNDGTVKFIRTEEELKQLRWK